MKRFGESNDRQVSSAARHCASQNEAPSRLLIRRHLQPGIGGLTLLGKARQFGDCDYNRGNQATSELDVEMAQGQRPHNR